MKKIISIILVSIFLNSCQDPSLKSTRSLVNSGTYDHWAQVFLAKSWSHGAFGSCVGCLWGGAGSTRQEAIDKAMQLCENSEQARKKTNLKCILYRDGSKSEERRKQLAKQNNSAGSQVMTLQSMKSTCMQFGYKEGTEKLADCMKELYLKETETKTTITATPKRKIDPSVWDDLLNISKGMSEGKSFTESLGSVGSSSSSNSSKIQCFKTGERISGTNKLCSYNCMGSEVVQNISSTSICDLSIDLN